MSRKSKKVFKFKTIGMFLFLGVFFISFSSALICNSSLPNGCPVVQGTGGGNTYINNTNTTNAIWGSITGTIGSQTDLQNEFNSLSSVYYPLSSNPAGYLTSYTETDPIYTAQNSTIVRAGTSNISCISGQFPSNQTTITNSSGVFTSWNCMTIPSAGILTYYFQNLTSDISNSRQMLITPQTIKNESDYTVSKSSTVIIQNYTTNLSTPSLIFIPAGEYEVHVHAYQSAGTANIYIYGNVTEINSTGGYVGTIGTSETSLDVSGQYLQSSETEYRMFFTTLNTYMMNSTSDRIKVSIYAVTGSSGAINEGVGIYVGGEADSHLSLPSNTIDASNFVPYSGAINNVNLGSNSLTASNLTATSISPTLNLIDTTNNRSIYLNKIDSLGSLTLNSSFVRKVGGTAFNFTGSNKLTGTAASGIYGAPANPFTVSMWIYPTSNNNAQAIFSNGQSGTASAFAIHYETSNNAYIACTIDYNNNANYYSQYTARWTGSWKLITCTWNGSNNAPIMYVNGGTAGVGNGYQGGQQASGNVLAIGDAGFGTSHPFLGEIDEVNMWNRVLTPTEVTALYNSGQGVYANNATAPFNSSYLGGYHFDNDILGNNAPPTLTATGGTAFIGNGVVSPPNQPIVNRTILTCTDGTMVNDDAECTLGEQSTSVYGIGLNIVGNFLNQTIGGGNNIQVNSTGITLGATTTQATDINNRNSVVSGNYSQPTTNSTWIMNSGYFAIGTSSISLSFPVAVDYIYNAQNRTPNLVLGLNNGQVYDALQVKNYGSQAIAGITSSGALYSNTLVNGSQGYTGAYLNGSVYTLNTTGTNITATSNFIANGQKGLSINVSLENSLLAQCWMNYSEGLLVADNC